ncbi:putative transmembrane protein, partial [Rhizoctonia solani 123E]
ESLLLLELSTVALVAAMTTLILRQRPSSSLLTSVSALSFLFIHCAYALTYSMIQVSESFTALAGASI